MDVLSTHEMMKSTSGGYFFKIPKRSHVFWGLHSLKNGHGLPAITICIQLPEVSIIDLASATLQNIYQRGIFQTLQFRCITLSLPSNSHLILLNYQGCQWLLLYIKPCPNSIQHQPIPHSSRRLIKFSKSASSTKSSSTKVHSDIFFSPAQLLGLLNLISGALPVPHTEQPPGPHTSTPISHQT